MKKTALLVIDIQVGTLNLLVKKNKLVSQVNQVIQDFHKHNLPVIFIKQKGRGNIAAKITRNKTDYLAVKSQPNAFTSAEFTTILNQLQLDSLVVVGLMSHACIQATCTGALKQNYQVTLISDAHSSMLSSTSRKWNTKLAARGVKLITTKDYLTL